MDKGYGLIDNVPVFCLPKGENEIKEYGERYLRVAQGFRPIWFAQKCLALNENVFLKHTLDDV